MSAAMSGYIWASLNVLTKLQRSVTVYDIAMKFILNVNLVKTRLLITYSSVFQSFRNFAQGMVMCCAKLQYDWESFIYVLLSSLDCWMQYRDTFDHVVTVFNWLYHMWKLLPLDCFLSGLHSKLQWYSGEIFFCLITLLDILQLTFSLLYFQLSLHGYLIAFNSF